MRTAIALLIVFTLSSFILQTDFLTQQKKFERVRTAIKEKGEIVSKNLNTRELNTNNFKIIIVGFKEEGKLEIYAKSNREKEYKMLVSYPICSSAGQLGPKRVQGDMQVPEGFYCIDRFNPISNYYLSLGLNYPNDSDRLKSKANNLGGDIFIHGSCVTIGCMPMTDDKIKEIYLYAIYATNNGQNNIPVYVFPFKMTDQNLNKHLVLLDNNKELFDFWQNIKVGYDKFEKEKRELKVSVDKNGNYVF